jgi:hypothetical protein
VRVIVVSVEDADEYRRRIGEVLRRHGFGWVLEEVEAQIGEGKPSSKQISERYTPPADSMFTVQTPKRRRASLVTSEPYSASERLEILLQAIRAAIIHRSVLEAAVLNHVKGITEIEFQPDASTAEVEGTRLGRRHTLTVSRLDPGSSLRHRAEHVLAKLEDEARADT